MHARLTVAICLLAQACAPRGPAASVVDLVRLEDGWRYCSAFELGGRLITAAHCTRTLGRARMYYVTAAGGIPHEARVVSVDTKADRAVLAPSSYVPNLERGEAASRGERVHALASMGRLDGKVLGRGGWFLQTDLDLYPGWSGSPVLDAQGRAVGVVVACVGTEAGASGKACAPNTGIFVGLDWP